MSTMVSRLTIRRTVQNAYPVMLESNDEVTSSHRFLSYGVVIGETDDRLKREQMNE